jgi:hypothetical protein
MLHPVDLQLDDIEQMRACRPRHQEHEHAPIAGHPGEKSTCEWLPWACRNVLRGRLQFCYQVSWKLSKRAFAEAKEHNPDLLQVSVRALCI